jgi:uncharacterized protein (TIGR03382 family)
MSIQNRLDRIVALSAVAATGATVGFVQNAEAAIVSSGPVNINIPSNTDGVYLNVVTGVSGGLASGVAGWDVNPWSSSALNFFNPSAPAGGVYSRGGAAAGVANLTAGYTIDASNIWTSGAISTNAGWAAVLNSSDNIIGFRFQNEANGNATHYGWMRISLAGSTFAQPRAIVEYAYEDQAGVGIQAGAVPTPGTAALLALGAVGMAGRRRK